MFKKFVLFSTTLLPSLCHATVKGTTLDELAGASTSGQRRVRSWLPCTLAALFKGESKRPVVQRRQPFDREALLMELLAAEHDDEEPDDGTLEGSGDDYGA